LDISGVLVVVRLWRRGGVAVRSGTYDGCIKNLGCPQVTVDAVVKACTDSGCSASQVRHLRLTCF
jgi:hypothetical protein